MWIALGIVGGLIVLILLNIVAVHNSLVRLKNSVDESFSGMDVYLTKRWDLVPNLVATVKGYAKHESEVLSQVVELRNKPYGDLSVNEKIEANNKLTGALSKIIALAESYPELKANSNFLSLSSELSKIESEIASSRTYFNATVKKLNNKIQMFPSNIIAKMFNYQTYKMFEATEIQRQNVKVEF